MISSKKIKQTDNTSIAIPVPKDLKQKNKFPILTKRIEEIIENCKDNKSSIKTLIAQLKIKDKNFDINQINKDIEKNDKDYQEISAEFKTYNFNQINPIASIIRGFEKAVDYLDNGQGEHEEYEFSHNEELEEISTITDFPYPIDKNLFSQSFKENCEDFQTKFNDCFKFYLENDNYKGLSILKKELKNLKEYIKEMNGSIKTSIFDNKILEINEKINCYDSNLSFKFKLLSRKYSQSSSKKLLLGIDSKNIELSKISKDLIGFFENHQFYELQNNGIDIFSTINKYCNTVKILKEKYSQLTNDIEESDDTDDIKELSIREGLRQKNKTYLLDHLDEFLNIDEDLHYKMVNLFRRSHKLSSEKTRLYRSAISVLKKMPNNNSDFENNKELTDCYLACLATTKYTETNLASLINKKIELETSILDSAESIVDFAEWYSINQRIDELEAQRTGVSNLFLQFHHYIKLDGKRAYTIHDGFLYHSESFYSHPLDSPLINLISGLSQKGLNPSLLKFLYILPDHYSFNYFELGFYEVVSGFKKKIYSNVSPKDVFVRTFRRSNLHFQNKINLEKTKTIDSVPKYYPCFYYSSDIKLPTGVDKDILEGIYSMLVLKMAYYSDNIKTCFNEKENKMCIPKGNKVACLIVSTDGEILSWALNTIGGGEGEAIDLARHAEVNALISYFKYSGKHMLCLPSCKIYTSLKSCHMCAGAIKECMGGTYEPTVIYSLNDPCQENTIISHLESKSKNQFFDSIDKKYSESKSKNAAKMFDIEVVSNHVAENISAEFDQQLNKCSPEVKQYIKSFLSYLTDSSKKVLVSDQEEEYDGEQEEYDSEQEEYDGEQENGCQQEGDELEFVKKR